jgi:hypothetical protein
MSLIKMLANRQARTRNAFANQQKCECIESTPQARFNAVAGGASATVTVENKIVPVKLMTNGWISPTTIAPVIISGGKGYFGGMPKGR